MERRKFVIPQVTDKTTKKEEPLDINGTPKPIIDKSERFVSSIYGSNVKDVNYYPKSDLEYSERQYDYLRNGSKVSKEEIQDYCVPKFEDFNGYEPENKRVDVKQVDVNGKNANEEVQKSADDRMNSYEQQSHETIKIYKQEERNDNNYQNNNYQEYKNNENVKEDYFSELNNEDENYNLKDDDNYQEETYQEDNNYQDNNYLDNNQYDNDEEVQERISVTPKTNPEGKLKSKNDRYNEIRKQRKTKYNFPSLSLLKRRNPNATSDLEGVNRQREIIDSTLKEFDIAGRVVDFQKGPTVTLFEVQLEPGVKYQKVPSIQQNLQGNLEAVAIRLQVPIPGRRTIGIEVPNYKRDMILLGDMLTKPELMEDKNPLKVVLGTDVTGEAIYLDITKMPHGLIGGTTRSGKSVCINSIITSILYRAHPDDVKLILIDPKKVEFTKYNNIPHLATPIITEPKIAISAMKWLVDEMEARYDFFASLGLTDYDDYMRHQRNSVDMKHIPYIVLIIDEFADLMLVGGKEIEEIVSRLTAKARAAGIHLIIATQRPSVDVISGTIKSNLPTRISFKVKTALDSNIILDHAGAEKLLGNGDMLYFDDTGKECRIQGSFVSNEELKAVTDSIRSGNFDFMFTQDDLKQKTEESEDDVTGDDLFATISRYVVQTQNASINSIQKRFKCSFNRAQAIIEKLSELGVVSENLGSRARTVLMEPADLEDILARL